MLSYCRIGDKVFVKYKYGDNYREIAQPWTIGNIINNNLWEEFYEYMRITNVPQYIQDKLHKLCDHIQYKLSLGKNFYCLVPAWTPLPLRHAAGPRGF